MLIVRTGFPREAGPYFLHGWELQISRKIVRFVIEVEDALPAATSYRKQL
jgi:hypothetical protein